MIAYVDESLRLDGEGRYVLAAVLVPPTRAEEVRAALRSTLRRGQRRYHWHDEGPSSRLAVTGVVAALGLDAVAVTSTPVDGARQERAAVAACASCCGSWSGAALPRSCWRAGTVRWTRPTSR